MDTAIKPVWKPEKRIYTADELLSLPDEYRCELIRGEIRDMSPPPGDAHGNTTNRFSHFANMHIYGHDLGEGYTAETGFLIAHNPDTVKAPDFAFVAKERLPASMSMKHVPVVPDLVLETRSPSDRAGMVSEKIQEWLDAGVRMALELNLQTRRLTVYQPDQDVQALDINGVLNGGDVLPGFILPIRKLFRDVEGDNKFAR